MHKFLDFFDEFTTLLITRALNKTDNWILIRGAKQLLTLRGGSGGRRGTELSELGLITDGSILLRNNIIDSVGPTRQIENKTEARHAVEISAAGRVVMPAFIDPHACLVPVPGYGDEGPKHIHSVSAMRLEAEADWLLKLMARHGTGTVGALSGRGHDISGELKSLRAMRARDGKPVDIVPILYLIHDGHAGPHATSHFSVAGSHELINTVSNRKLASMVAIQCGIEGVPRAAAESLLSRARSLKLEVRLEMAPECDPDVIEMAVNAGVRSVCGPVSYGISEMVLLSHSSTFAILLPQLVPTGGPPGSARPLIDHGVLLALGSALSPEARGTASMQTVIQSAVERLGLSLAEAISAATINAAWALGVGSHSGSLEARKAGDVILLDVSDYREIPMLAGTNLTHSMLKRGVILFKEDFPGWPSAA